jgi:hypothetical protein
LPESASAEQCAVFLGLHSDANGLQAWDGFDAVLTPGDSILPISWRDPATGGFEKAITLKDGTRLRRTMIFMGLWHVRPARGAAILP